MHTSRHYLDRRRFKSQHCHSCALSSWASHLPSATNRRTAESAPRECREALPVRQGGRGLVKAECPGASGREADFRSSGTYCPCLCPRPAHGTHSRLPRRPPPSPPLHPSLPSCLSVSVAVSLFWFVSVSALLNLPGVLSPGSGPRAPLCSLHSSEMGGRREGKPKPTYWFQMWPSQPLQQFN